MLLPLKRLLYSGLMIKYNNDYKKVSKLRKTEEFSEFQEMMVKKLLNHASENVEYYKTLLESENSDEFGVDSIHNLPILTKAIIRENFEKLRSKDYNNRTWFYVTSGGSTGEPLKIMQDDQTIRWSNIGHFYYCNEMLGVDEPRVKKVILWGNERDVFGQRTSLQKRLFQKVTKTLLLNCYLMTEENMARYINTINSYKPEFIRGYASCLYELCKFAEEKNMPLHAPNYIESTSENLSNPMRETIESTFGTKVSDFYGSRELSSIAGECEQGNLHLFTFKNYVEILDRDDKPVKTGEEGRVVVTDLSNYSMPLIRYEIGDMAILGKKKCECGNPLPTLEKVVGRITDSFVLKNGTIVPAEYFTQLIGVYCNKGLIEKFQVLQEDYDLVRIKAVAYPGFNVSEEKEIEHKIKLVMGKNCKTIWEYVEDISKTRSGKYLFTQSHVN
ncbi:capsular polysaccharide biosynthesis protein [Methanobacterium petrolearium]|nr:capsular polysaccharide biosynthesis protein [Methanobacterium petrolearium]